MNARLSLFFTTYFFYADIALFMQITLFFVAVPASLLSCSSLSLCHSLQYRLELPVILFC